MLKAIANIMSRVGRGTSADSPSPAASREPHGSGPRGGRRLVVAKFDSAQTTADNRKHWANADGLSPNAAINPEVRRVLRNRARYEVANNSYAKGIVLTLANDTIGTGPRLQMLTGDAEANARIEDAFDQWSRAVDLPGKLRTMRMARAETGEAFALLVNNPGVASHVSLDVKLIEADQVCSPLMRRGRSDEIDGILLDQWGNPSAYRVLKRHPGDSTALRAPLDDLLAYDTLPAASVVHYYRADRPGQLRGIPDITPALPLFAQLRRYTLATIAAAETAANFAAVIYTDAPANGEADPLEPMDEVELEQRLATVLPGGWKLGQVHAEQPTTTFGEFKREILNEIARCLNMPFNVAAGNSSGYNYASGRLDHQVYFKSIRVEQHQLQLAVLDRILKAWLNEAVLVEGLLPQSLRTIARTLPEHAWFWDGVEHVDPAKEATAQATRLANHTTTLAVEFARQGRDWEQELRQRAKELALMNELGLAPAASVASTPSKDTEPADPVDEETASASAD
ncbi:MAG: phage portal protein [Leptolyngbya sp. PLA3]|nr:MAG: phage portal protein [Cyanobacteria bacterium CYA]MCE7969568.1 phage portal protein [Leptolyngbya sp. PL-A3]